MINQDQANRSASRVKGARNKLSGDFVSALSRAFDEIGEEAIRIVAKEEPAKFLSVVASVLPKEFEINDNRLKDIPDDQIDAFIEFAQRYLAGRTPSLEGGEDSTPH